MRINGRKNRVVSSELIVSYCNFCVVHTVYSSILAHLFFNFFKNIQEYFITQLHVFWELVYATYIPPEI